VGIQKPDDNLIQIARGSRPDDDSPVAPLRPSAWKVAFVQDCNLHCDYCCTGHGRFGGKGRYMRPELWMPLSDLIVALSPPDSRIDLEFGGGETFLRFREAMQFLDHLRRLAAGRKIRVDARILTNGTVMTPPQLQECLERKITLYFSIDGPAFRHDAFRKFPNGRPTHRIALENWRRYRELVGNAAGPPECAVATVIAGDARLPEIAQFWREQGVKQFKALPAEPSRFLPSGELQEWQGRRDQYLQDLRALAFSEADRLRGRDFETEYEGPLGILLSWRRLKGGAPHRACGAGYSMLAVDVDGKLFPCQGFVGFEGRSIGDIHSGVDAAKLEEFRAARLKAQAECKTCWAGFLCNGGCCAGDPEFGVVLDTWNGCELTKAHVEIAVESFHRWQNHAQPKIGSPA
jgi:uncharacterized protein